MDIAKLTAAQVLLGFFMSVAALVVTVATGVRFVFAPRIRQLIKEVVEAEFASRDEAQQQQQRAEESALKALNGRMGKLEERMAENEKASARTEEAVQRIEQATMRQTQTLEAIAEGIGEITTGMAVQQAELKRAQKDIEELQRTRRRTR